MASVLPETAANAAKAAFSSATLTSAKPFTPRKTFEVSSSIIRSYFLGHHHAALSRMRRTLSNVGLVIECRDMRVPLTSWNPLLESTLMYGNSMNFGRGGDKGFTSGGSSAACRARIIVYTHKDLVPGPEGNRILQTLAAFHQQHGAGNTSVLFHGAGNESKDTKDLLREIKRIAQDDESITGMRALVVGMPNAGKSSLLNRLRSQGKPTKGGASRVAKTGSEPGVTRKVGTPVRIIAGDDNSEGVFVLDTPGVFIPYVPDAESMLKLTLAGCVKDGLISWVTVADYLLFHLNRFDPTGKVYAAFGRPTNDVHEFLRGVAKRTGKLRKGEEEFLEGAADWVVRRWRNGRLGQFVLDEVTWSSLEAARKLSLEPPLSMNQARKREKEARKDRALAKHAQNCERPAPRMLPLTHRVSPDRNPVPFKPASAFKTFSPRHILVGLVHSGLSHRHNTSFPIFQFFPKKFAHQEPHELVTMDNQSSLESKAQALLSTICEKDDPADVFFELLPTPEEIHGVNNPDAHVEMNNRFARVLNAVVLFVEKHEQCSADPDFAYIFDSTSEANWKDPKSSMKCLKTAMAYVALVNSRDKEASSQGTKKDQLLAYYLWRLLGAKDEKSPVQVPASINPTGTIHVPSHDFLPSSRTRCAPCSNCGNAQATSWCSGCCIMKSGKTVFATFYCNHDCMKAHWGTHKPACKEVRALRRAATIFTELWFEDLRVRNGDIESVTEQNGLIEMRIMSPDRRASLSRGPAQPLPRHLFESEEQVLACVSAGFCEDVLGSSIMVFDLFIRSAGALVEALHVQPKNAHKTVLISYHNGKHDVTFLYFYLVFRITLRSGMRFVFDPAGAQNGWQEYLAPWDAYEQHRIHFIMDIRKIGADFPGVRMGQPKPDDQIAMFHILESGLGLRLTDGGMEKLLYKLPDARFETSRVSLIKTFKEFTNLATKME